MTREESYHLTLDALAKVQWNVALMLDAKAVEAEKVRNWLLSHLTTDLYQEHNQQLASSLQFHEMNVEVIDGLTKLCNGLNRTLKAILNPDTEDTSDGMASMFGGFGGLGEKS